MQPKNIIATQKLFSKVITFIELTPNQIILDPTIVRKTKQALLEKRAINGFLRDDINQFSLVVNNNFALDILQLNPPTVTCIDKKLSLYGLVASYGLIHLLREVSLASPHEKINCLLVERCSDADLAHLYASAQLGSNYLADNIAHQEWDAGRLHDCFDKRPTDAQFAQLLRMSIKQFQDTRAAQNRANARE